jgi:hypothetical protein
MLQALTYVALGLGLAGTVLAAVALAQLRRANRRLDEVTPDIRGLAQRVRGQSAEQALAAIFTALESTHQKMALTEVRMAELDRIMSRAIRRVGLVRFDASDDIRGDLSFALCMLDSRDNGLMLTSNYTLEDCRIYVRGIIGGKARHDLLREEAEALEQALSER